MAYLKNYMTGYREPRDQEYFESKFECRIEDSKEYNQYVRSMPYHKDFYDVSSYRLETKVIPMKAIHLPAEMLEELLKQQKYMDDLTYDAEYGKKIVSMLHADERVRDDNPAVQKAYRNYLTLLELARK